MTPLVGTNPYFLFFCYLFIFLLPIYNVKMCASGGYMILIFVVLVVNLNLMKII